METFTDGSTGASRPRGPIIQRCPVVRLLAVVLASTLAVPLAGMAPVHAAEDEVWVQIRGTVTDASGPVDDVDVVAYVHGTEEFVDAASTDSNGAYVLADIYELGTYTVCVDAAWDGYVPVCQDVVVGPAGATGRNFTVVKRERRMISGRITDDRGRPVASAIVEAIGPDTFPVERESPGGQSNADGTYEFDVWSDTTYKLCFGGQLQDVIAPECWHDKAGLDASDDVVVGDSDLTGYDAVVEMKSIIRGRVTVAGVGPSADLFVQAVSESGNPDLAPAAGVAPDGTYVIPVAPGTYTLRARGRGVIDATSTEPVVVGSHEVKTVDMTTTRMPGISGSVTGVLATEQTASITAYYNFGCCGYDSVDWASGTLSSGGASTFTYRLLVDGGSYRIRLRLNDGTTYWYGGTSLETATDIVVPESGFVPDIDFKIGTSLPHYVPGVPTVTGRAEVGQTLNAHPGTWPADTQLTYTWPDGSHGKSYTVRDADLVLYVPIVSVKVTGTTPGYAPVTQRSGAASPDGAPETPDPDVPDPVDPITAVSSVGTPTVAGTPQVGRTLSATPGAWSPGDVTVAYQWLRDGVVVPGATSSTYNLLATDLRRAMSVRVTGSKAGLQSASATSTPTTVVTPGVISGSKPRVSGTMRVGKKLRAKAGAPSPAGARATYQWFRQNRAIRSATKASYKLVAKDRRKKIRVRVTYRLTGHTTLVLASAARRVK